MTNNDIFSFFKRILKPYIYGPFGLPTAEQIKDARASGHLLVNAGAALLFHIVKNKSTHKDFAQRTIILSVDDICVDYYACNDIEAGFTLLRELKQIAIDSHRACWLFIHEEAQQIKYITDELFEYIGTKISAFSELIGIYAYLPPGNIQVIASVPAELNKTDQLTLTVIKHNFITDDELKEVRDELNSYNNTWAIHYSKYNVKNSWSAFALRGFKPDDPMFIIKPTEMTRKWQNANADLLTTKVRDTIAASHFPFTSTIAARLPGAKERIRFMGLNANNGALGRHSDISDRFAGTSDGYVGRFHIPIITSDDCIFSVWDHRGNKITMTLEPRNLYYLDVRKPHAVINMGPSKRVHFVIDIIMNKEVRAMLEAIV